VGGLGDVAVQVKIGEHGAAHRRHADRALAEAQLVEDFRQQLVDGGLDFHCTLVAVDAIADAMYRLVTDASLRAELARRGLENVKRFSWEKCARETLAVLESVAEK